MTKNQKKKLRERKKKLISKLRESWNPDDIEEPVKSIAD